MGPLKRLRAKAPSAAKRIQARWRGVSVRNAVLVLRSAVETLQRWFRQRMAWRQLRNSVRKLTIKVFVAATLIQSTWRGVCARRQYKIVLEREKLARSYSTNAIRKIQLGDRRRSLIQSGRGGTVSKGRLSPRGGAESTPNLTSPVKGAARRFSDQTNVRQLSRSKSRGAPMAAASRLEARCASALAMGKQSIQQEPGLAIASSPSLLAAVRNGLGPNTGAAGGAPAVAIPVDRQALLTDLESNGTLSPIPKESPWSQEDPGKSDLEVVHTWLTNALPSVEVQALYRVECAGATAAAYSGVRAALGPERLLWHGTPWDAVGNITKNGFNRAYCGRHGARLGKGSYFAEDPAYSLRFCGKTAARAVFLAGVLPGRFCRGEDGAVEPPLVPDSSGARFDSTVDDVEKPRVFCVFRDFQAIPLYLAVVCSSDFKV